MRIQHPALIAALLTLPLGAQAQLKGYKTRTLSTGQAELILTFKGAMEGVSLELTPKDGGKSSMHHLGKVAKGKKVVRFTAGASKRWKASIEGKAGPRSFTANFAFKLKAAKPLNVTVNKRAIKLDKGTMRIAANQPLSDVMIIYYDEEGEQADTIDGTLSSKKKGRAITINWAPPTEEIKISRVVAQFTDEYGGEYTLELTPFFVEIPHEDVVFESGSSELKEAEQPKLDAAIERIEALLEKLVDAGSKAKPKLYVGGYTDSVGKGGDNKRLSLARAKAIAAYFVGKVKIPVHFQGFGEKGQAVKTADNVDEARNRRAAYVLAVTPPRGGAFPGGGWRRAR